MIRRLLQHDAQMTYHEAAPWQKAAPQAQRPSLAPGHELEASVPARPANIVSDVTVPLFQAVVTGCLAGLVAAVSARVANMEFDFWRLWVIVCLPVSALTWLVLLGQTRRLLWAVERLVGLDLDGDGRQGDPGERVIIVNGRSPGQRPANREQFTGLMGFVARLPVKGTSLRDWEGELGRDTYQYYRDSLIESGWADWNSYGPDGKPNERQGWALTADVAEVLEHIVA